jgi:hypothetical protein
VAAHARGINNIIHALLRIDFAENAHNNTIDHCNRLLSDFLQPIRLNKIPKCRTFVS